MSNKDFVGSAMNALNPLNLLKRIFLFFLFAVVINLRQTITNLNDAGKASLVASGLVKKLSLFVFALWDSLRGGVKIAFVSTWAVISDFGTFISTMSIGSIFFSFLMMIGLVGLFFQPISLIINIFDGEASQGTSFFVRLIVTIIVVLIMCAFTFYLGGAENITQIEESTLPVLNDTINGTIDNIQNITNQTNNTITNGGVVVAL